MPKVGYPPLPEGHQGSLIPIASTTPRLCTGLGQVRQDSTLQSPGALSIAPLALAPCPYGAPTMSLTQPA